MKEFDEMMARVGEAAESNLKAGAIIHLENLLAQIKMYNCETVSQVQSLIHNKLEDLGVDDD